VFVFPYGDGCVPLGRPPASSLRSGNGFLKEVTETIAFHLTAFATTQPVVLQKA
jgi:hypothetical protein